MKILFQSKRLLFRKFNPTDAGLILELNNDPEVVRYLHEPPTTAANARAIITDIIMPQYELGLGRWAVHLKFSEEFIGWCGLKYMSEKDEIDLGYRFKKEYWGNGYATEAAQTCINYAFAHLNINSIVARAHINNLSSIRVIEKCGMTFLKEEVVDDCPVRTYQLLK